MTDMSPSQTFMSTLGQTPPLASQLNGNLTRLKNDLDEIIQVLTYPKTLADDLSTLKSTIATAQEVLSIVEVVPEVGEAAAALAEALEAFEAPVAEASTTANKVEDTVKPLREALQKVEPYLDDMIKATQEIQSDSQTFLDKFTGVYNCVESLPDGDAKSSLESALNSFSVATTPPVHALNSTMSLANTAIEGFFDEIQKVVDALNPLQPIISAVNDIINDLNPIISAMDSLKDALEDIKIPVPIPYPTSVSLYDIFKFFGSFSDLINEALKAIGDPLGKLMDLLEKEIPGLPDFSALLNLVLNLPQLPDFSALEKEIEGALEAIEKAFAGFNLQCPPE